MSNVKEWESENMNQNLVYSVYFKCFDGSDVARFESAEDAINFMFDIKDHALAVEIFTGDLGTDGSYYGDDHCLCDLVSLVS